MSKIEVNAVEPQCGTTLTLGASGDTITVPTGATINLSNATQTGVGKAGAVDWQTGSIKTSTFTATSGEGYFCNTSGGAFTVNLPAGSAGAIVSVSDYTRTFQTNNLTVSPNGSEKIGGIAADATLSTEGQSATFVYVDGTEGWINVQETSNSVTGVSFITATGGTITTSGNCKIHTFTGPGTFCVSSVASCSANNVVSYVVVAGGGGAGGAGGGGSGGGGAGGYRETKSPATPYTASPKCGYSTPGNRITVTATAFPITVGSGGAGGSCAADGGAGGTSTFSTITSAGGGGGGHGNGNDDAVAGGSGGGGGQGGGGGASGNTPPVTPPQGSNGGNGSPSPSGPGRGAGGGGGATANGGAGGTPGGFPNEKFGGAGGAGATSCITASPVARAGGGGGGGSSGGGAAGAGGGGVGGGCNGACRTNGTANTGGGAGGGERSGAPSGGSGIVIIRYKFQ